MIGLICGTDAAAKRDVVETRDRRATRRPGSGSSRRRPGRLRAVPQIGGALRTARRDAEVDVIVLARGGGSFEDLLPFSDERLVPRRGRMRDAGRLGDRPRAGHAAGRPRGRCPCRHAQPGGAAGRSRLRGRRPPSSTRSAARGRPRARGGPTAAASRLALLVVAAGVRRPAQLDHGAPQTLLLVRDGLDRWPLHRLERERTRLAHARDRLRCWGRPPRWSAATRSCRTRRRGGADAAAVAPGDRVAVRLSHGRIAARVEGVDENERRADVRAGARRARADRPAARGRPDVAGGVADAVGARRAAARAVPGPADQAEQRVAELVERIGRRPDQA